MEWVNYGENYLYDNPRMALSVYDKAIEFNSKIDLVYYKKGFLKIYIRLCSLEIEWKLGSFRML